MKLLLIEDEKKVAAFIRQGLTEHGFVVDVAHDGVEGESMTRATQYDLLIVDVMLPRKSGFALARAVREFDPNVPVLMLTALDSTDDKVQGLESGADDYLVKPFEFRELLARIRALLRRGARAGADSVITLADLRLDPRARTAARAGKTIDLTAREYALLEYLMVNRGRIVSRADIAEHVWETWFDSDSNVIDVYISFLRKKIDRDAGVKLIHTVIGMGYTMKVGED